MRTPAALRVGLTGGIGSGKSTVAELLVSHGAHLVDTDLIARQLTGPGGAALSAIAASFGPQFLSRDGSLDRPRMRHLAFSDPSARSRLESILHPMIGEEAQCLAAKAVGAEAIVFDIPLLVESRSWPERLDRVWVVDCRETTQINRIRARPGWTEAAARSVIAQQASRAERRAAADAVLHNDGISIDELALAVAALWQSAAAHRSGRRA